MGPELTGSDRANPDYILENVLDPSAAVAREYTVTNVATTDGRLVSGIIREQNDRSMTIQTANERIVLPREDIEDVKPSGVSMMPEGQLEQLSPAGDPRPVRLPGGKAASGVAGQDAVRVTGEEVAHLPRRLAHHGWPNEEARRNTRVFGLSKSIPASDLSKISTTSS